MHDTLTVTQTAKMFGLHANTLRGWERRGVLVPARDSTNRRVYTPADRETIRRLLAEKP